MTKAVDVKGKEENGRRSVTKACRDRDREREKKKERKKESADNGIHMSGIIMGMREREYVLQLTHYFSLKYFCLVS
jgi:hypothetical protein